MKIHTAKQIIVGGEDNNGAEKIARSRGTTIKNVIKDAKVTIKKAQKPKKTEEHINEGWI